MVTFGDNEFEIAIVTYNRAPFIKEWIAYGYEDCKKRNIKLSIYDSSTNDDTEQLLKNLNDDGYGIEYHRVPSETPIGYKPMLPILNSGCEYVWVAGDSRRNDFAELDAKVFPFIKQKIEYILISAGFNEQNDQKIYTDKSEFLLDCFISTTCIGLSIYKISLFDGLKSDASWMADCDRKYKDNYGFGWLGYFYEAFAKDNYKAAFAVIKILNILPKQKKQAWAGRFYECWVENLCDIMDYIPDVYKTKNKVPRDTWVQMNLDGWFYSKRARDCGGLTPEIYKKYLDNGMLERVTDKTNRIKFFACAPQWQVNLYCLPFRALGKCKSAAKKILKRK